MFLREHTESVASLRGVGRNAVAALARLGIQTVADLVTHYPRDYQDRRVIVPLARATELRSAAVLVTVVDHAWIGPPRRKTPKIHVRDQSAEGHLLCFNRAYLARALPVGARCYLWGSFSASGAGVECSSFEHELYSESPRGFLRILPVYGATTGLGQGAIRRAVAAALDRVLDGLEDELPPGLRAERGLPSTSAALREVHHPSSPETLEAARRALAFEELVYLNLAIARSGAAEGGPGPVDPTRATRRASASLRAELIRRLPFRLTDGQLSALAEIARDLRAPRPMRRLLQGDVGCGKTLVALLAALDVIQAGEQVALLAPTELLARQHAESAARLLEPLGVRVALLISAVNGAPRDRLLEAMRSAAGATLGVDLVVGTHALFSSDVVYRRLGLVVIDEQQRFGVEQRAGMARKGAAADLLQMTATPIPRSLALTLFGDLEHTEIHDLPPGRRPVVTHLARAANAARVYDRVRRELDRGRQAYFVYPVISSGPAAGLRDAERMYVELARRVYPGYRCELIHSRVPEADKAARMEAFASGGVSVLVATSVVEVGVDVPNATCMVVEHAERFGLSDLHQLRGRVGRGAEQSYVFLVYGVDLTEGGVGRLRIMKETSDGFRIAEEDLRLRGPGAFAGLEQAGYLRLGIADPSGDPTMLAEAARVVRGMLAEDPALEKPEHTALRESLRRAPRFASLGAQPASGRGGHSVPKGRGG